MVRREPPQPLTQTSSVRSAGPSERAHALQPIERPCKGPELNKSEWFNLLSEHCCFSCLKGRALWFLRSTAGLSIASDVRIVRTSHRHHGAQRAAAAPHTDVLSPQRWPVRTSARVAADRTSVQGTRIE